jgi:hypothetical protein
MPWVNQARIDKLHERLNVLADALNKPLLFRDTPEGEKQRRQRDKREENQPQGTGRD